MRKVLPYQAESRGGLVGRQLADLFQPDEKLLCTPENDHRFVNLLYDVTANLIARTTPARS